MGREERFLGLLDWGSRGSTAREGVRIKGRGGGWSKRDCPSGGKGGWQRGEGRKGTRRAGERCSIGRN